ncbi:hypothetical protein JTB14_009938 [Gonioctena quinquepunctata]|nr:hypothetical protein JTB14_009938 [Gonioctena quinquepunctata]
MIVQAFQALLSRYPEHSNFYTDASKSEDKVGAALVFQEGIERYPLPPSTSVYSDEIFAILQAVKYITSHGIQKTTPITDSLSAVKTLEKVYCSNPNAMTIKEEIYHHTNNPNQTKRQIRRHVKLQAKGRNLQTNKSREGTQRAKLNT